MQALLANQTQAITQLLPYKVGALFMEPGTGKTRAALELVRSAAPDLVIWFTPFQTKANLAAEIEKQGGLKCEIIGIETISASDRTYLRLHQLLDQAQRPFIVVDESLKIKNASAKRTERMLELSKKAEYKLVLNGTPLSRDLLDLYTQMCFLSPKILEQSYPQFKDNYCEYKKIEFRNHHRTYSREFIIKYHNLAHLYALIKPYVVEHSLKLDVHLQQIELTYKLTPEEKEQHDLIKEKYLDDEALLARNNNIFLELTQKMQHNYSLSPEKFQIVRNLLSSGDPTKFLIYAKYIDTQNQLRLAFPNVPIMSLQKHSYGLNLQAYNRIVIWDNTWDYALIDQLIHRVYRVGQQQDCIIYKLRGNVGLETLMANCINNKQNMLQAFKQLSIKDL